MVTLRFFINFCKLALKSKNDSAFPNGCLHNNCNVAPVRAFRLSPSKIQTRSKVQALLRVIPFDAVHITVIIESVRLCGIIFSHFLISILFVLPGLTKKRCFSLINILGTKFHAFNDHLILRFTNVVFQVLNNDFFIIMNANHELIFLTIEFARFDLN